MANAKYKRNFYYFSVMKNFTLAILLLLSFNAIAQPNVTFTVLAPLGTNVTAMDVTGNWTDSSTIAGGIWNGGFNLTNTSGNVWTGTIPIKAGAYQAKFRAYINGSTTATWETVPVLCADTNANRTFSAVNGTVTKVGPFCFGSCDSTCPTVWPVTLNFKVNMNNTTLTLPTGATKTPMVNVTGSFGVDAGFSNWAPGSIVMTETSTGSKIFTKTVTVKNSNYAYKFLKANDWNEVINTVTHQYSEQKDSFSLKTCLVGNDRSLDLSAAAPNTVVNVDYFWQSCSGVNPSSINDFNAIVYAVVPNPTTNGSIKINLFNTAASKLVITNNLGQIVHQQSVENNITTINNLPKGLLYGKIFTTNGLATSFKIIVQ